jgi:hypothetical protein
MKSTKIIIITACAIVAVVGAITAIIVYRNEIANLISDFTAKVEGKIKKRKGDFADFEDV